MRKLSTTEPAYGRLQAYKAPAAPKHLSAESRRLWRQVMTGWELDDGSIPILMQALEALDEVRAAQVVLEKDGLVAKGRNGEDITHPAYRVLKGARQQFLQAWKQLKLEEADELPLRVGRPPGGRRR